MKKIARIFLKISFILLGGCAGGNQWDAENNCYRYRHPVYTENYISYKGGDRDPEPYSLH